jgi:hypothetical protein
MSSKETIEIAVETRNFTDRALLVFDGSAEVWIPRSLIEDYEGDGDTPVSITIPAWLAEERGLV